MIRMLFTLAVCAVLASVGYTAASFAAPRSIASPARFCSRVVTDDMLRAIPQALVPAAERAFGLAAMPARMIRQSTVFRCFERHVLLCTVGANLPCGKADIRNAMPAADAWCAEHAGAGSIPAFVVGHATIYDWKCDGAKAAVARAVLHVDRRGFVAEYWKPAR